MLMLTLALVAVSAESVHIRLVAYVPETVTISQTSKGVDVNVNTQNASYGFYDGNGNLTDAKNASVFMMTAT